MTPVVERYYLECPLWPADREPFLMPLRTDSTPGQVGAVVWALVQRSVPYGVEEPAPFADVDSAIAALLEHDDEEDLLLPGGLRVAAGSVVIDPGCCFGLDEWRDWLLVGAGKEIFLGHDPEPTLEQRDGTVRLWQDVSGPPKAGPNGLAGPHIDIPHEALPSLLAGVRLELTGFLAALRRWAQDVAPAHADRLVVAVDRRLRISAPLDA